MHNLTLVFTGHRLNGLCNAEELLKILGKIEPEVIFEEFCLSEFDFLYERGNVEARAIKMYQDFKPVQHVSVDRFDIPKNLHLEIDKVLDYVEQASQDYRELKLVEVENVRQYGFIYLNSVVCDKLTAKLCEIEDRVIVGTGNQELICGLDNWRKVNRHREMGMVGNIYKYSRENDFDTGVFLVGSAHKAGIVNEIKKYVAEETNLIKWNFALT